jgi:putative transposase
MDCSLYVYNYFLKINNELFDNGEKILGYVKMSSLLTELKKNNKWLTQADSSSLQNSIKNLDEAFLRYFKKQNNRPKYKEKLNKYKITCRYNKGSTPNVEIIDNRIKLPKLGWVKFFKSRNVKGKIFSVTITRRPSSKYFISIACDNDLSTLPKTNSRVGIDLGIKDYATFDNGNKINNPKFIQKLKPKLLKLEKQLRRKSKDGSNYNKAKIKLARLHEKIKNQRRDFLHKLSTEIIKENQIICMESLQVKQLLKEKKMSELIADASWAEFKNMLLYKCELYGRTLILIDKYFPSSKLCSVCGFKNDDLKLKDRKWKCMNCNEVHDRDVNAAINILNEGLKRV